MAPLRNIVILLIIYNIMLILIWISTENNQLTDNFSRFQFRKIVNMNL